MTALPVTTAFAPSHVAISPRRERRCSRWRSPWPKRSLSSLASVSQRLPRHPHLPLPSRSLLWASRLLRPPLPLPLHLHLPLPSRSLPSASRLPRPPLPRLPPLAPAKPKFSFGKPVPKAKPAPKKAVAKKPVAAKPKPRVVNKASRPKAKVISKPAPVRTPLKKSKQGHTGPQYQPQQGGRQILKEGT